MILFIAPNPHKTPEKEGFLQRVTAIDALFPKAKKLYSDDLRDTNKLANAVVEADLIYVHSMYNANKILPCYSKYSHKIITDMHGVVPEEEVYADNMEMARTMAHTEKEVFRHGKYFVAVTHAMAEHFKKKYREASNLNWTVLPIFNETSISSVKEAQGTNVIYAGGAQSWQNVPLMVEAINNSEGKYSFTILTHNPEAFQDISKEVSARTVIKTVESDQIANYYKQASLGFVLRSDSLVNNVACPTKLVEYLAYGVVPIVLSEKIGDFKKLGYQFVTLKDFTEGAIDSASVKKMAENNSKVYKAFIQNTKEAKRQLITYANEIMERSDNSSFTSVEAVALIMDTQEVRNQNIRYEYQIKVYKKKINDYAEAVKYYQNQLATHDKNKGTKPKGFGHSVASWIKDK